MATYTINTTAKMDAAISAIIISRNASRALRGLPALTATQMLTELVLGTVILQLESEHREIESEKLKTAYDNATLAQQLGIRTVLGL